MIDTARNMIVEKTREDPSYTHLLFVDDDQVFPPDALNKLLSHDKDIVGAQIFKRRPLYEPCVYTLRGSKYFPILVNKFAEVDAIGTGMMLIKTEVFNKIEYPWFETVYDEEKTHWSVDFMFCKKAKKLGYKIYCDPTIEIGHLGDAPVRGKQDFLKMIQERQKNLNVKEKKQVDKDTNNKPETPSES